MIPRFEKKRKKNEFFENLKIKVIRFLSAFIRFFQFCKNAFPFDQSDPVIFIRLK